MSGVPVGTVLAYGRFHSHFGYGGEMNSLVSFIFIPLMVLIVFSHFSLSLHSDPVIFLICSLAHFLSYNFRLATLPQSACSTQIFGNGYSTRG